MRNLGTMPENFKRGILKKYSPVEGGGGGGT